MDERQDIPKVQKRTRTQDDQAPRRQGEVKRVLRTSDPERPIRPDDSERGKRPERESRSKESKSPVRENRSVGAKSPARENRLADERRPVRENRLEGERRPVRENRLEGERRPVRENRPEGVRRPMRENRLEDERSHARANRSERLRRPEDDQQFLRQPSRRPPLRTQSYRTEKKRKGPIILIFLIVLLLIAGAAAALYWNKYGPSDKKADQNDYYGIENENQLAVTIDNEVIGATGMIIDGVPYIDYATVRDYINSRFYWDPNENILLYTLPQETIRVDVGSNEYTTAGGKQAVGYAIVKTEGSATYIALDFVQQRTNLDFTVSKNPNRVMIVTQWGDTTVAEVKSKTQVRWLAGVKSDILREIDKKEQVTVIEDEGDWKKVRTNDGYIGYIKNRHLKKETTKEITREFEEEAFTNITKDYTINLGWHQVTSQAANNNILEVLSQCKGMTTISPTWFSVADNSGKINSIASSEYVDYAHQANVEVWALVDNFSEDVDSFELLSHTSSRETLTNQLIAAALQTGIDGINVDFENITQETGEHFIQFVRELSVKCRQNGIVLSVDNYVPKGFSTHYNRREQGVVADYVIIMGYDEHYGGSSEAGSVASLNFVKEGIAATVDEVPAEKVINAVPFYTRLWSERPKTDEEVSADVGTEAENYPLHVESQAMGMSEAAETVAAAGVTPQWDEETQQDYAQWEADGLTYKIWLENNASLEAKLTLMKEYGLAGTAAWKIGFETSETWELILKYVN